MDARQLETFLVVAQELNLRQAGRQLKVSQPAVTSQLQELESELGFPLVIREQQRLVGLTPAGQAYREAARTLLAELRAARRSAMSIARGKAIAVRVGIAEEVASTSGYWVAFRELQKHHVHMAFQFIELPVLDLPDAVRRGTVDLALTIDGPGQDGLEVTELWAQEWLALLPQGHPLAARARLVPADMAGVPLVLGVRQSLAGGHDLIERAFERAKVVPDVRFRALRRSTMLILVNSGVAATFVPPTVGAMRLPCTDSVPFEAPALKIVALSLGDRTSAGVRELWEELRQATSNFTYTPPARP
ncbi:LysR family transcriptional regulator [Variovorax terrae]|uniref:LysR family transcriptional regulator n=1 Tax=Variovorax terrae TaxID=2923278 RepID=A0A9X1VPY7_9BURK|nr:LysR family transcriptional regulator [Variovorax terrae]MCJ0761671.1 LysR family transcriptional regulator [Variovorax terrae]